MMLEIIPVWEQLDLYAKLAEKYGLAFEYNDFFQPDLLDDEASCRERILAYQSLNRPGRVDTLHGVFFDILPFSFDSGIRRQSLYRMRQSLEIADKLGCRGVVFHTNFNPDLMAGEKYRENWLERMRETVCTLLSECDCEIFLENMFDRSAVELEELAVSLQGENRFGICLDVAHMRLSTDRPREWFERLSPYIRHFHINDTQLMHDEHLALGQGKIDWREIEALIGEFGLKEKSRLLEVNGLDKINLCLEYCQREGIG